MHAKHPRSDGSQSAFEWRTDEELCREIARRHSVSRTSGKHLPETGLHLRLIAEELRCLRPSKAAPDMTAKEQWRCLQTISAVNVAQEPPARDPVLARLFATASAVRERMRKAKLPVSHRDSLFIAYDHLTDLPRFPAAYLRARWHMDTPTRRKRAFAQLGRILRAFILADWQGKPFAPRVEGGNGNLKPRLFSYELLRLLAVEWLRDSEALEGFLTAIFKKWKRIDPPQSAWRRSVLTHQLAVTLEHDAKRILTRLQEVGAISTTLSSEAALQAELANIRQMLSREPDKARAAGYARHVPKAPAAV